MDSNTPSRLDGPGSRPWQSDTCFGCKHQLPGKTCLAFPDGIPETLWSAYRGHREPYPGDHGIQYEQIPMPTKPIEIPVFLLKKKS